MSRSRMSRARRTHSRGNPFPAPNRLPVDSPRVVRLLSYDITEEPMPEPAHAGTQIHDVLGPDERAELFELAQDDPHAVIPRLRELIERHPDVPVLHNWLTVAYMVAGDHASADRTAELLHQRHPQYLFGRIHLAQIALRQGDLARFEAIFEKKFDLKLMYPQRSVFHISEFLSFSSLMVEYYVRTEHDDAAEKLTRLMEQMAPDSRMTKRALKVMEHLAMLQVMKKAMERLIDPPKRRRKKPRTEGEA